MIGCKGCQNEVEEYIPHCRNDSDLVHVRLEFLLCGILDPVTLRLLRKGDPALLKGRLEGSKR